jgi:hypothetical protein
MTDNVRVLTSQEKHVAEQAMWRVAKEYCEAKNNPDAAVNIWHLPMDMEKARRQAVQALKENEQALGHTG